MTSTPRTIPPVEPAPGMLTDRGRIIEVTGDRIRVCLEGACSEIDAGGFVLDLEDRATFLLCLDALAVRTGLDTAAGFLWYLSDPGTYGSERAWVLEATDEVRTRDGDTDDPREALVRALEETAPG